MDCQFKKKKKYLELVNDELRLKGETLEEHKKHCKAKPGNCPFERHLEEADRIPTKSSFAATKSKYRGLRNVQAHKCAKNGTYDLETGEPVEYTSGYQVSFQEETTERPGGNYIKDTDYDALVERITNELGGSRPHLGTFGEPEISWHIDSMEKALEIARRHNQESIFDWSTFICIDNKDFNGATHYSDLQNHKGKNYETHHAKKIENDEKRKLNQ